MLTPGRSGNSRSRTPVVSALLAAAADSLLGRRVPFFAQMAHAMRNPDEDEIFVLGIRTRVAS